MTSRLKIQTYPEVQIQVPRTQNPSIRPLEVSTCKKITIIILLIVFFGTLIITVLFAKNPDKIPSRSLPSTTAATHSSTISVTNTPPSKETTDNASKSHLYSTSSITVTTTDTESSTILFETSNPESTEMISTTSGDIVSEKRTTTLMNFSKADSFEGTALIQSTTVITTTTTMATTTAEPPNLLINPGAQEGLNGWSQTGLASASLLFDKDVKNEYYCRSGGACFSGGRGSSGQHSKLSQDVHLLNGIYNYTETQIDSGQLMVYISFYYQTLKSLLPSTNDVVKVDVTFHNSEGPLAGGVLTTELRCLDRNPGWCHYSIPVYLTRGTRLIRYAMMFYLRGDLGNSIDCYIDDNSLIIK